MSSFPLPIQVRWSDLDPNNHVLHSVYYDWGAQCRTDFFVRHGLTPHRMQEAGFGPILLREECIFRKEIRFGDLVTMDLALVRAKRDYSRWSIRHKILLPEGTIAALLTVDGAWMDLIRRKLVAAPELVTGMIGSLPVDPAFEWLD
jgi:acyl-CoA thioester hydrolase